MSGLGEMVYVEGIEKGKTEVVLNMYKKGLTPPEIADYVGLSEEKVEEIIRSHEVLV